MRILLLSLYLAILVKDVAGVGGPYLLRGATQVLALVVGAWWLATHRVELGKYTFLALYLAAIAASTLGSADWLYSLGQVLSLAAICLFFIAYSEHQAESGDPTGALSNVFIYSSAVLFLLSLIIAKLLPEVAYWAEWDGTLRFRGIFNNPASLGGLAGAALGVAIFRKNNWLIKGAVACMSATCMALTLTRTFWIAAFLALAVTAVAASAGNRLKWGAVALYCSILIMAVAYQSDITVTRKKVGTVFRAESVATMSGRTLVWEKALDLFWQRPVLGYGFETGYLAFGVKSSDRLSRKIQKQRYSMHNGYIQSLLDSGVIGLIFYLAVLLKALGNVVQSSRSAERHHLLYMVLYVAIANLGISFMFDASQPHSILNWYFVVSALSIGRSRAVVQQS